jgi:hypothetical protein
VVAIWANEAMSPRKRPSAAFWTTVVVVVALVVYPLSAGPGSWIVRLLVDCGVISFDRADWFLDSAYAPAQWAIVNGPEPLRHAVEWYMQFWV